VSDPGPEPDSRIVPLGLEVTERASVRELAKQAVDVSVVINNAGEAGGDAITTFSDDSMWRMFDVNVFGMLRVAQEFAPVLAANGGGTLVSILSVQSAGPGVGAMRRGQPWPGWNRRLPVDQGFRRWYGTCRLAQTMSNLSGSGPVRWFLFSALISATSPSDS
jgi:NAD(P)-dependent dehydrogenase (short-subunit alcohol dehydrogenase family)